MAINVKDFFFFFILRGWFSSAWHSDVFIWSPPNRANTVCDLLAKSLTTPSHPSAFLPTPISHYIFPSLLFSRLSNTIFLSLCLFTASPFFHMHTKTFRHTRIYCTFSQDSITHSSALTSLTKGDHCQLAVCASECALACVCLYKCGGQDCCRNSEVILKCSSKNHSGMTFQY